MVVVLNPGCILLCGMFHVYKSEESTSCSFRDVMTSKTLASIQRLKIVELFGPVFLESGEARRKEAFHTITDFALLHV